MESAAWLEPSGPYPLLPMHQKATDCAAAPGWKTSFYFFYPVHTMPDSGLLAVARIGVVHEPFRCRQSTAALGTDVAKGGHALPTPTEKQCRGASVLEGFIGEAAPEGVRTPGRRAWQLQGGRC